MRKNKGERETQKYEDERGIGVKFTQPFVYFAV